MRPFLSILSWAWLWTLVAAHLVLRVLHPDLGSMNDALMPVYFFGLNAPTLVLGSFLPRNQLGFRQLTRVPYFWLGMAIIMVNFMSCGSMLGGKPDLAAMLAMLTAQSLWLAWPAYCGARSMTNAP